VDKRKSGLYHEWSLAAFTKDAIWPSYPHGEAGSPAFEQTLNDAIAAFDGDRNVDKLCGTLVNAAKESVQR